MERAGCLVFGTVPSRKAQQHKEVDLFFPPLALAHLRGWIRSSIDLQGEEGEGSNVSATDKATDVRDTVMSRPGRRRAGSGAGSAQGLFAAPVLPSSAPGFRRNKEEETTS